MNWSRGKWKKDRCLKYSHQSPCRCTHPSHGKQNHIQGSQNKTQKHSEEKGSCKYLQGSESEMPVYKSIKQIRISLLSFSHLHSVPQHIPPTGVIPRLSETTFQTSQGENVKGLGGKTTTPSFLLQVFQLKTITARDGEERSSPKLSLKEAYLKI